MLDKPKPLRYNKSCLTHSHPTSRMSATVLTDATFDAEVLKSSVPTLVDFWAPWCGPCKIQSPIVEQLASEFAGTPVKVGKLNVDENPAVAGRYQIMSIPTTIFFKGGAPVEHLIGLQDKHSLASRLKRAMK